MNHINDIWIMTSAGKKKHKKKQNRAKIMHIEPFIYGDKCICVCVLRAICL